MRRAQLREAHVPLPSANSTCAPPGAAARPRSRQSPGEPRGPPGAERTREVERRGAGVRLGSERARPRGGHGNTERRKGWVDPAEDAQGQGGGAEVSISPCASRRLPCVEPCGSRWSLLWGHLSRVGLPRPSLDLLPAP